MVYDALDIARYVINRSIEIDAPVTNLKLQKLLYYIQAAFLVEKDKLCFNDPIVSWRHGPVIRPVYNEYRRFQNQEIEEEQIEYSELIVEDDFEFVYVTKVFDQDDIDNKDRQLIDKLIDSYKDYQPWSMVKKTHQENPWIETNRNENINNELIKEYYGKGMGKVYGSSSA